MPRSLLILGAVLLCLFTEPALWAQPCNGNPAVVPTETAENPSLCEGYDRGFKIEPVKSGTYTSPDGLVEVTLQVKGKYVSWTSCYPLDAVTVKGGPGANIYAYDPSLYGADCLSAPINPNPRRPQPYGLSYISFCYSNPSIDCPADVTIACLETSDPSATGTATTPSMCLETFTIEYADKTTAGACASESTIFRTWTAKFSDGSIAQCTQQIDIVDELPPTLVSPLPPDLDLDCAADVPPPTELTFVDNCLGEFTVSPSIETISGSCENDFTQTRTWTASDGCGNSLSLSQVISVIDTLTPVLVSAFPASMNLDCADDVPPPTELTFVDNCSGEMTVSPSIQTMPGSCENDFTQIRTWTAVDDCGNSFSLSQVISVIDTLTPVLVSAFPASMNLDCADDVPPPTELTFVDNCSGEMTVSPSIQTMPGSCENDFTQIRTWTAVDDCGNSFSLSQVISVIDTLTPVLVSAFPASMNLDCADDVPPPTELTFVDNCSGEMTVSPSIQTMPGSCENDFTQIRTWTAVDDCGNSFSLSQVISVIDTLTPVLVSAFPASMNLDCADDVPPPTELTFVDNCSGEMTVSPSIQTMPGSCENDFTQIRTWTAVDDCGNSFSLSQVISVIDTLTPVLVSAFPASMNLDCADDVPPPTELTFVDNCSGEMTVSPSIQTMPGSCENDFTQIRTWTAVDDCGNSFSLSQVISVIDTLTPVLVSAFPASMNLDCADDVPPPTELTFVDNCSGEMTVSPFIQTIPGSCENDFTQIRTWTAVDDCGNSFSLSQTITASGCCAPARTAPTSPVSITSVLGDLPAMDSGTARLPQASGAAAKPWDFTLAPNPAREQVRVTLSAPIDETLTIEVFDLRGRQVVRRTERRERLDLDLATLSAGVYLVRLYTDSGEMRTRRLVVTR